MNLNCVSRKTTLAVRDRANNDASARFNVPAGYYHEFETQLILDALYATLVRGQEIHVDTLSAQCKQPITHIVATLSALRSLMSERGVVEFEQFRNSLRTAAPAETSSTPNTTDETRGNLPQSQPGTTEHAESAVSACSLGVRAGVGASLFAIIMFIVWKVSHQ